MFVLTYIRVTIIKYKKNKSILHKLGGVTCSDSETGTDVTQYCIIVQNA